MPLASVIAEVQAEAHRLGPKMDLPTAQKFMVAANLGVSTREMAVGAAAAIIAAVVWDDAHPDMPDAVIEGAPSAEEVAAAHGAQARLDETMKPKTASEPGEGIQAELDHAAGA